MVLCGMILVNGLFMKTNMRTRKTIEESIVMNGGGSPPFRENLIIELLLDIRELLIKQDKHE